MNLQSNRNNVHIAAIDNGKFKSEIVPIEYKVKKETHVFDTDEFPNRTTVLEKLSTLRPAFKKEGSVTAGNASGINDGASFVLIASEEAGKTIQLNPCYARSLVSDKAVWTQPSWVWAPCQPLPTHSRTPKSNYPTST